jgi:hypothetical protein
MNSIRVNKYWLNSKGFWWCYKLVGFLSFFRRLGL